MNSHEREKQSGAYWAAVISLLIACAYIFGHVLAWFVFGWLE